MKGNRDKNISKLTNQELSTHFNIKSRRKEKLIFLRNIVILTIAALLTLAYINKTGAYPWGSDTYGHLFKGNIIYDGFRNGKLFLNYDENWYNGIQPFRYWAPLPYYILAIINLTTNNIIVTYNVFIYFVFIIGGIGWLSWGYYTSRQNLALVLAILWFFIPNNLRILFSEGNIPFVTVNTLIPFVFLYYYKSMQEKRIINYLGLTFFMSIITLSHAMISAMLGISLFILAFIDSIINKNYIENLLSLIYAFLGTMISSFWLYPALKGGIIGLNKEAVARVMEDLTYFLSVSLNPFLRFENIEVYYFGLAFAVVAVFGLVFSNKAERAPFISSLIILVGTTKIALPFLQKLPMNQLFWMSRFTSIAMAMIILALILWKSLRKSILMLLVLLLIIDSVFSFNILGFNRQFPSDLSDTLDTALRISDQRIGVLDSSSYGSFPSYYIVYNSVNESTNQVFGWAWQGAATAKNIVALNTGLENGYYELMFDRALELGADTLVVKKNLIRDYSMLENAASIVGYKKYQEEDGYIIYKYPSVNSFGTRANYEGIAIGRYSPNAVYLFPKLQTSESEFLDDYTYNELKNKKVVFLSGFKFKNKEAAEDLVLKLSRDGVKVVIDITGFDGYDFLGVRAEPITLNSNYGELIYKNKTLAMKDFPNEYNKWRTYFLNGIDNQESYGIVDYKIINYIGTKDNDNLIFIGLNLPYYTFLTKDKNAINILESELDLKAFEIPEREMHQLDIKIADNTIEITSDASDVIVPIAALDAFEKVTGDYKVINNLIYLRSPKLEIRIGYPYIFTGIALSIFFLVVTISLSIILNRKFGQGTVPVSSHLSSNP